MHPIQIQKTKTITDQHWRLYLLADPERAVVQLYLTKCQLWEAQQNQHLVGVIALLVHNTKQIEIKNLAVDPKHQGHGIATQLIHFAIKRARQDGYQQMIVGTGSTSAQQLLLYQRCGFRVTAIKHDFFVSNYTKPIYENGIQLKDMLVLSQEL